MIKDRIENLKNYENLLPSSAIKHLLSGFDLKSKPDGRFEVDGEEIEFGIRLTYETKESTEGLWESHRRYLDLHIVLEGREYVEVADRALLNSTKDYDADGDYELWEGQAEDVLLLEEGEFLVLFPHEAHKTSVKVDSPKQLSKVVLKLKANDQ